MNSKKAEEFVATGRRKRAVAGVRLRRGSGKINVNRRLFEEYFPSEVQRSVILSPLVMVGEENNFDLIIRLNGGGVEGQVIASRLGIARALVEKNEDYRGRFKTEGFLTRDPRKKERKKFGHKKARKSFQFSKR